MLELWFWQYYCISMGQTGVRQGGCGSCMLGGGGAGGERSFEKMIGDFYNFSMFLETSDCPGALLNKFCGSYDRRPSGDLGPFGRYFWATLYELT